MNKDEIFRKIRQNYQTEAERPTPVYQSLEIEPPQGGKSRLYHDNGAPVVSPQKPKFNPVPQISQEKSVKVKASRENIPFQPPPVFSGMNEEQMWFSDSVAVRQDNRVIDNNDETDIDSLQGKHFSDIENGPFIQNQPEYVEEKQVPSSKEESFPLNKGEFAIMVDDETVLKTYDLSTVRSTVNSLIFEHSVDIDRINVLKNLSIDVGVILSD